jgi:ATP-dependent exoDNAse (exonuclease V) beta subunit
MLNSHQLFIELNKFNGISFNEAEHSYYFNGKKCISVTQAISKFKKPFETEIIASRYAKKHGLDKNEVMDQWKMANLDSTRRGSQLHKYAEMRFSSKMVEVDPDVEPLCEMFDHFYNDSKDRLIPIRCEFVVGDYDIGMCGTLDKLFYNVTAQEIQIWDYKTNKEISRSSKYKNMMTNELSHLQECEFTTYSLQLSLYKILIERNTSLKLGKSYLVWINEVNDKYKIIGTDYMEREANLILNSLAA